MGVTMTAWSRVSVRALATCATMLLICASGILVPPASAGAVGRQHHDRRAPQAPASLVSSAASSTLINSSASASTDNIAVSGYRVYRDGASVNTSTITSYADEGLAADTSYTYQVAAYGGGKNQSERLDTASAAALPSIPPQDAQAPTAPTKLSASPLSTSQVSITWDASTDNIGVAKYKVYRQGSAVAFPTTTTYIDAGLSAGTAYSYQVSAQDAVGNDSPKSNAAVTVTPSPGNGGAAVTLPAPGPDLAPLPDAPKGPGDAFTGAFTGAVTADSPIIAAWNETVFPDESFTMTGKAFTTKTGESLGSDTTVWVGVQTQSGFQVKQAQVWNVDDKILTATLPADLPMGMFLVWVENSAAISTPIAINRTRPQWIGPKGNIVAPGEKARVFGRNLSRNHGTSEAFVYSKASGSSNLSALKVGKVEPFAVEFTAPSRPGTYEIYVHNGHGGSFGWGEPLKLIVQQPWVRDSYTIVVPPSGGDDGGVT